MYKDLKNNKQWMRRYEEGKTSLHEEKELVAAATDNKWFSFINENKKEAPQSLKEGIWSIIEKKQRRRRLNLLISSAAACFLLIISVLSLGPEKEQSYEEKLALLLEAKSMVAIPNTTSSEVKRIIYEDNMVIIYNPK